MDYSAALHSPGSGRNGWSCGSPAVETPSPSGETVRGSRPRSACRGGPATAGPGLPKACQARMCVYWGGREPTTSSTRLTAGWPAPEAGPKLARHAGLLPRRRGPRPQGRAVALPLTRTPARLAGRAAAAAPRLPAHPPGERSARHRLVQVRPRPACMACVDAEKSAIRTGGSRKAKGHTSMAVPQGCRAPLGGQCAAHGRMWGAARTCHHPPPPAPARAPAQHVLDVSHCRTTTLCRPSRPALPRAHTTLAMVTPPALRHARLLPAAQGVGCPDRTVLPVCRHAAAHPRPHPRRLPLGQHQVPH